MEETGVAESELQPPLLLGVTVSLFLRSSPLTCRDRVTVWMSLSCTHNYHWVWQSDFSRICSSNFSRLYESVAENELQPSLCLVYHSESHPRSLCTASSSSHFRPFRPSADVVTKVIWIPHRWSIDLKPMIVFVIKSMRWLRAKKTFGPNYGTCLADIEAVKNRYDSPWSLWSDDRPTVAFVFNFVRVLCKLLLVWKCVSRAL